MSDSSAPRRYHRWNRARGNAYRYDCERCGLRKRLRPWADGRVYEEHLIREGRSWLRVPGLPPCGTTTAPRPCPFCGHRGPVPRKELRDGYDHCKDDPDAWAHYVFCVGCATFGPWAKSESSALAAWNRRPRR